MLRVVARGGVGIALPGVGTAGGLVVINIIYGLHRDGHRGGRALTAVAVDGGGVEDGGRRDVLIGSNLIFAGLIRIPLQGVGGGGGQGDVAFAADTGVRHSRSCGQRVDDDLHGCLSALALRVVVDDGGVESGAFAHGFCDLVALACVRKVVVVPFHGVSGGSGGVELHRHTAVGADGGSRSGGDGRSGGKIVHGDGHVGRAGTSVVIGSDDVVGGGGRRRYSDVVARSEFIVPGVGGRAAGCERRATSGAYCVYGCHSHRRCRVDGGGHLRARGVATAGVLGTDVVVRGVRDVRGGEGGAGASFATSVLREVPVVGQVGIRVGDGELYRTCTAAGAVCRGRGGGGRSNVHRDGGRTFAAVQIGGSCIGAQAVDT